MARILIIKLQASKCANGSMRAQLEQPPLVVIVMHAQILWVRVNALQLACPHQIIIFLLIKKVTSVAAVENRENVRWSQYTVKMLIFLSTAYILQLGHSFAHNIQLDSLVKTQWACTIMKSCRSTVLILSPKLLQSKRSHGKLSSQTVIKQLAQPETVSFLRKE